MNHGTYMSSKHFHVVLTSLLLSTMACAGTTGEQDPMTDEAELRALKRNEVIGFIQYGDTRTTNYSAAPLYRAYQFRANAFDKVVLTLTPDAPGTSVWATLLDEKGVEIISGVRTDRSPTGATILTYTMPAAFAERTVAFREASRKTTKISVKLESTGIHEPASPFVGASGPYAAGPGFRADVQDLEMRCVSRSYYRPDSYAPEQVTEREAQGTISLDLASATPKIVGADDVFSPPRDFPEMALENAVLAKTSEFANSVTLTGKTGTGVQRHLLQVVNVDARTLRVEYGREWMGHTGTVGSTLSCVGVQKL